MTGHDEVFVECVNGKDTEQMRRNVEKYGFKHHGTTWRPGEGGLWYSSINAWSWAAEHDEDLMVFEDDAVPFPYFADTVEATVRPEGYDFVSLYTPYRNDFQTKKFEFNRA